MTPTPRTKALCDTCLSIIETGSPERLYGVWVYLKDGAGLTAGAHQGTDRSNSVDRMVRIGVAKWEAAHGPVPQDDDHLVWRAKFWALPIFEANATVKLDPDNLPGWAVELGKWWESCSVLQEFRDAQDQVFHEDYWLPAVAVADEVGLTSPLGMLVAYDSMVQSGLNGPLSMRKLRRQFSERSPKNGGNEAAWLSAYVRTRRAILSHHPKKAVRTSAYRTEALLDLCNEGNIGLTTPFVMRAGNKRVRVEEP